MIGILRNEVPLAFGRMLSYASVSKPAQLKQMKEVPKASTRALEPQNVAVRWPPNQASAGFLCWHPQPEHPYEHSLPIKRDEKALAAGDSIMRQELLAQSTADHVRRITRSHGPNWKTLGTLFNDDWHQFRPKPRQSTTKDLQPVPPPEREGELPR